MTPNHSFQPTHSGLRRPWAAELKRYAYKTMMKNLSVLLLLVLLVSGQTVLAKTINLPAIPIEVAVDNAKKYVLEKKIDISDAFIGIVEYHNLHNEYERPYWRVRWVRKIGAKGAWFELRILSDGSIEERPGK